MQCARIGHELFFRRAQFLTCSSPSRCKFTYWVQSKGRLHFLPQPWVISRRAIKFKPADKTTGKFIPQHRWDRVPSHFSLIYSSNLKNWIGGYHAGIAVLGVLTGVVLGYEMPHHWESLTQDELAPFFGILGLTLAIIGTTSFFGRRFVIRIYQDIDQGQFIAVHYSFFGRLKRLQYTLDDVQYQHKPDADFQDGTVVKIKGKHCHLTSRDFVSPVLYNMHLGHGDSSDVQKSFVSGPKF